MTYPYADKQTMFHPRCATCKKKYVHWFNTTIYCGECELNGRANEDRKKPKDRKSNANKEDQRY